MDIRIAAAVSAAFAAAAAVAATNEVADLGTIEVVGSAVSRYRPDGVNGGTFTDAPAEELPVVVDALTEDFIREHNPTDLHDLMRFVPGIETGGKSLLVRQPGTFSIRGLGGTEPAFDGVMPIGRGAGLFMDPFLMERIEVVKGPIGALAGGAGSVQNASGAGGAVNMYMKSAKFGSDEINVQGNLSSGRRTWRTRGMFDVNETGFDDRLAVRAIATADWYSPTYINQGSQKGARPRESFAVAPSFAYKAGDDVVFGLKTMFQQTDQPSYIGVPVWRGHPAAGWSWRESSCRRGDRAKYRNFMLNPWLDLQVSEKWLLKFGAGMVFSDWDFFMREPYYNAKEVSEYYRTGRWSSGGKYMVSGFSQAKSVNRNYNVYARSIWTEELFGGVENTLVVQPDYNYRESSGGFGTPVSRYGLLLQDSVKWGWFTVLGGVRYDHFEQDSYTSGTARYRHTAADALSPRGGLTIRPLDWLVFFGNLSQTRTPMLGLRTATGSTPSTPWRATQYEGGVRVRPAGKLWLALSAYRIEQENVPEFDNTGLVQSFDGRNTTRGAEMSVSGDVTDDWTLMGMYSFNTYTDRNVAPGKPGRDFERYPAHSFTLSTSYRLSWGWFEDVVVGGSYRFRSKSYGTMRGSFVDENIFFAPSHVVDLNVSMPLSKFGGSEDWMLTFGVRNLFGEKYFESARHFYESLVGEPRTFEIGIRGKF